MRILAIVPFYKPAYIYGGPTRSVPALMEGFVKNGLEVSVFTTNANGQTALNVDPNISTLLDGVSVTYFKRDLPGSYFFSKTLTEACLQHIHEFDFVYIALNWCYPFWAGAMGALKARKPFIVSPRTSFMRKTWRNSDLKKTVYHYALERSLINRAAAIHYTTALEETESGWLNLRPPKMIVANPVDMEEFQALPQRGKFRDEHLIPTNSLVILYLGRVEHRKGIDFTVKAFAEIADQVPGAVLVIAGPCEENYQEILKRTAMEMNVIEKVQFTGYLNREQRLSALMDSDVFILSSYSENFGMSVIEAMASGLPIIVSEHVGVAEDVVAAKAGFVVPLDVLQIAHSMKELLNCETLRKSMGACARRFALQQYNPQAISAKMIDQIGSVLNGNSGRHFI
jgi:glycosyltransferase involved in cell wall biosynthesis